jgi:hypothetical protein
VSQQVLVEVELRLQTVVPWERKAGWELGEEQGASGAGCVESGSTEGQSVYPTVSAPLAQAREEGADDRLLASGYADGDGGLPVGTAAQLASGIGSFSAAWGHGSESHATNNVQHSNTAFFAMDQVPAVPTETQSGDGWLQTGLQVGKSNHQRHGI